VEADLTVAKEKSPFLFRTWAAVTDSHTGAPVGWQAYVQNRETGQSRYTGVFETRDAARKAARELRKGLESGSISMIHLSDEVITAFNDVVEAGERANSATDPDLQAELRRAQREATDRAEEACSRSGLDYLDALVEYHDRLRRIDEGRATIGLGG
jgi:hypothetical protein